MVLESLVRTSLLMCFVATAASAAPTVVGDIVVVEDSTGEPFDLTKHPGAIDLSVCAFGTNGLYQVKSDVYDAAVVFTTNPMTGLLSLFATPAGNPVRQTDQGVAYGSFFFRQQASAYGSAAQLKHCVFAGPLTQWPSSPDSPFSSGGYPTGETGVAVLGHEFGHHWMVWAAYDKGNGLGPQALFRGNTRQDTDPSHAISSSNLHWSAYADTGSVMYGNFITDNQDGTYTLRGGDHKYGYFDQYLMGLRAAQDVPPMLVIDDGTGLGSADFPVPPGQSQTITGLGTTVTIDDLIRAIGPRVPAYPNAQSCFRFAFVLVTQAGHTPTSGELAQVDAYRTRWETWYAWATDGRGSVDTRLDAINACPPPTTTPDAGTTTDAGQPEQDAGTTEPPDAGGELNGAPDAGTDAGAGMQQHEPPEPLPLKKLKPGCGCDSAPLGSLAFAVLLWLAVFRGLRRWL